MVDSPPTIGALYKAKVLTDEAVEAAVAALLAGRTGEPFSITDGYTVDLAAALEAHPPAARALADPDRPDGFKHTMARTAVLLARGTFDGGG